MTKDTISEELESEFTTRVDGESLRLKMSLSETADVYRELASAFCDRATGLDREAEGHDEEDEEDL